jgi:hypothetical protein
MLTQVPSEVHFMVYFFCHGFSFFHIFTILFANGARPKWVQLGVFFTIFVVCVKMGLI